MSNFEVTLQPLKRPRLSNEILTELQRLLSQGLLKAGDKIPSERVLADQLKVSRNTVREAIRALEVLGVLEVKHGDGTFVKDLDMSTILSPVWQLLLERKFFLIQTLEFRRVLEPPIARLAAERATQEDIVMMRAILEKHEQNVAKGLPAIEEDHQFHLALAVATHNQVISSTLELVANILKEFRNNWAQSRPARSTAAHHKILKALELRDPTAAEQAMFEHLTYIENLVQAELLVGN